MIVVPPTEDEVTGYAAQTYRDDLEEDGFVWQPTQALALNPDAAAAFESLVQAIVPSIGQRVYELATLAAARGIGSPHCLLAHGRNTLRAGLMDEAQLTRVAVDYTDAELSDADVAVMTYAEKLSTADVSTMTDADGLALREAGFSDRQIIDITLAAAARNYLSRTLLALSVPVDDLPGLPQPLSEALLSPTRT